MYQDKKLLVTSAIEETILAENPIIFLGEWCIKFSRKKNYEKLKCNILSYHWDDYEKKKKDYIYLASLYEEILKKISKKLNELHKVNYR